MRDKPMEIIPDFATLIRATLAERLKMEKKKEIDDATYRKLVKLALSTLSHYFVGFALPTTKDKQLDAHLGGSGTLVSIGNIQGILTAEHVINLLKEKQVVGLILPSHAERDLHRPIFNMEESAYFVLPDRGEPSKGPDLGLLIPPPQILETLRARKSFYNLSKRRDSALTRRSPLDHGVWVLSGIANEWVADGAPERGYSRVKVFRGGLGAGIVTKEHEIGRYDYLVFEALYNEFYEGPDSFEGFSGGSLWQILLEHDGATWKITNSLLSGVAFFQSTKKNSEEGTIREIICQGSRSIYRNLIDRVHGQLPK
jgi:hypothetical protein